MGQLMRIWLKPVKGEPLQEVGHASVRSNHGLVGNAERGGPRQVTVLSAEDWEAANTEVGAELDPSARRANILVTGLERPGRVHRAGAASRRGPHPGNRRDSAVRPHGRRPSGAAGCHGSRLAGGRARHRLERR